MVAKKTPGVNGATRAKNQAVAHTKHPAIIEERDQVTKPAPTSAASASRVSSAGNNFAALASLGGTVSTLVKERHLKILFWGPTGGGKTEMVLRNFPGIACLDTEGNTDVCVDKKEIPPFYQLKTRDIRRIQAVIAAAKKPITLPIGEGILLQTIDIDSGSVLWAEQSDVASALAEQRAQRKNQDADNANITQRDWTIAKRPLKRLMLEFSLTSVPFLVMTAREKDQYEGEGDAARKIGVMPDLVKNSLYDFNLAVRLWVENGKRMYEITKVQGSLGDIFPQGSRGVDFPIAKLMEYAKRLEPGPEENLDEKEDGPELSAQIAAEEIEKSANRTSAGLVQYAKGKGLSAADVGAILKQNGFTAFDPSRWNEMVHLIDQNAKEE